MVTSSLSSNPASHGSVWKLRYSRPRWPADTAGPDTQAVTYKIADCRQERRAAFRLVHDAYARAGLMQPNRYGLRVTPYHLLPTTDVLIAKYQEQVIYSLTVISDDQLGLPLESMYPSELDQLRQQDLYLAEVTAVATRPHCLTKRRMFSVFVNLMGLTFQYACSQGIDRLVITVHPRQFPVYGRLLGYDQCGPQKNFPALGNRPAIAAQHDVASRQTGQYPLYGRLYAHRYPRWQLLRQPMLQADRAYFQPAAELCGDQAVMVGL